MDVEKAERAKREWRSNPDNSNAGRLLMTLRSMETKEKI